MGLLNFKLKTKQKKPRLKSHQKILTSHGSFDSKLENYVYGDLLLLQKDPKNKIKEIQRQKTIQLLPGIAYRADFKIVLSDDSFYIVEAKGFETEVWLLKKKIYKVFGPAPLEVWKGSKSGRRIVETIIPDSSSFLKEKFGV